MDSPNVAKAWITLNLTIARFCSTQLTCGKKCSHSCWWEILQWSFMITASILTRCHSNIYFSSEMSCHKWNVVTDSYALFAGTQYCGSASSLQITSASWQRPYSRYLDFTLEEVTIFHAFYHWFYPRLMDMCCLQIAPYIQSISFQTVLPIPQMAIKNDTQHT